MSCARPFVPLFSSVTRLVNQVRVSASSESSRSSESTGVVVCETGIVAPWCRTPADGFPGAMLTSMSFSGVFGTRFAAALAYSCFIFDGSISMWMTPRPFWSEVPVISPTCTPATLTGSPSPGTTAAADENSPLTE